MTPRACARGRLLGSLLIGAAIVLAACSRAPTTPAPTPQQMLATAQKQMQSVSAFHFLLTHQNGFSTIGNNLNMTQAEGDFVAPDRLKASVKATFQTLPVAVNVISIDNQSWITNPLQSGDHYLPLPNGPQTTAILDPNQGLLKAASDMRDPKQSGSERLGSVDTNIISGTVDAGALKSLATDAEAGRQVPAQIWIGKNDSLVYRVRLSGPLSAGEPQNIVRQVDLSQFNESVTIQPPSS
jgi:hypothetical protein